MAVTPRLGCLLWVHLSVRCSSSLESRRFARIRCNTTDSHLTCEQSYNEEMKVFLFSDEGSADSSALFRSSEYS